MHTSRIKYLSWAAFLAAICAWGLVGLCTWTIFAAKDARIFRNADSEQTALRQASALRTHALARDTKDVRAQLEAYAYLDVLSIVDTIESVKKDARVGIDIGQALSAGENATSLAHTVGFIVEARGSFSAITHAAALLQSLPIPSAVDQMQFERMQDAAGSPNLWRLTARMRVFTTADISS